jgi:serine/threonine protein kinase
MESLGINHILDDKYKIIDVKYGGIGVVYICTNISNKEKVVIKTLYNSYFKNEHIIKEFYNEAYLWFSLGFHPNIVSAEDILTIQRIPYLIIEYGGRYNLREFWNFKSITQSEIYTIALQICRGMIYATSKIENFVHADLKPENFLIKYTYYVDADTDKVKGLYSENWNAIKSLEEDEKVFFLAKKLNKVPGLYPFLKITDFGLSKMFSRYSFDNSQGYDFNINNKLYGTLPYMSPEQCQQKELDQRSDIYSFEIILHELFTKRWPYKAKSREEFIFSHINSQPDIETSLPMKIQDIISKCLNKEPDLRYHSFQELNETLEQTFETKLGFDINDSIIIGYNKHNVDFLVSKILTKINFGKYDESLLEIETLINENKLDDEKIADFAEAFARKDNYKLAIHFAEKALSLNDKNILALNVKAISLIEYSLPLESIETSKRILEIMPNDYLTLTNIGSVYCDLIKDYNKALGYFDKALSINPDFPTGWTNKGNTLAHLNLPSEAMKSYKRALQLNPNDTATLRCIGAFYNNDLNLPEKAIEFFDKLLAINPKDYEGYFNKSISLLKLQKYAEALNCIKKAVECNGTDVKTRITFAECLAINNYFNEAIEQYSSLLSLGIKNSSIFLNIGVCLYNIKEYKKASTMFKEAMLLEPSNQKAIEYFINVEMLLKNE